MERRVKRGLSPPLVSLCVVAIVLASAQAQFPGDRLPIEEVSLTDIFRACEVPIESEFSEGDSYPQSLMGVGVAGTWAYEQTSLGMIRNPSLLSSTGKIDMWISNDTSSGAMGLLHDISAVFYLTGQAARNDALESTVMVRSRGQYVPSKGVLCLLGCQESLLPTLFTAKGRNITGGVAGGVGDGDLIDEPEAPMEDENIEAGVAHPIPISQEMETQCRTRIVLRFSLKEGSTTEATVNGRLESLRQPGEPAFFSPIVISASTGAISSQVMWFQLEMIIEAVLCAIQAACVILQIVNMRKHVSSPYVSLTMISVQIFVYGFYWIRSLYYPLRYLNSEVLLYFLSDVANIPRFVEFTIFVLYVYLAILVDSKRRKAPKPKSREAPEDPESSGLLSSGGAGHSLSSPRGTAGTGGPGTSERQLAVFFWPAYVVVGVCMWFSYDFDTFLRLSTFLFLLPQVVANYLWDPPQEGLGSVHVGYAVGNTLTQMVWLAYEVMRPRLMGYDAFFAFPHAWYWSSMLLMLAHLGVFVAQRLSGGRFDRPVLGMSVFGDSVARAAPGGRSTEMAETKSYRISGMVQP